MADVARLLIFALLLSACSVGTAGRQSECVNTQGHQFELYKQGGGRVAIVCTTDSAYVSCWTNGWPDQTFRSCSTADLLCVFDEYNVLAVPSEGVMTGQTYEAFGARLKVERCFGDAKRCELALISSVCATDSTCACRRADVGKTKLVFYWSRDLGVTTFYSIPNADPDEVRHRGFDPEELEAAIPLQTFFLVGTQGFLRVPMPLKSAKLRTDCKETANAPIKR